ncbi:MAG TPA: WhiB family transcriptional regulator [Streptosporangiaceae bacterium]
MATEATGSWWDLAACRSADPESFFPVSSTGADQLNVTRAKAMCARCPIRQQCLDFAIDSDEAYGIWGGTSEEERRHIAARRLRDLERVPA